MIHRSRPDLTEAAVASLRANTEPPYHFALIDNASGDDLAGLAPDELITNRTPLSFSENRNRGLTLGRGEPVVLLTNDILLPPGWLLGLLRGLDAGAGLVEALSNADVPLKLDLEAGINLGPCGEPADLKGKWPEIAQVLGLLNYQNQARTALPKPAARFFCVALSGETIDAVGRMDESFGHGGEALDYSFRVWESGRAVVQAVDGYVIHFGGRSNPKAEAGSGPEEMGLDLPLLFRRWPQARLETVFNQWRSAGIEADGRRIIDQLQRRAEQSDDL